MQCRWFWARDYFYSGVFLSEMVNNTHTIHHFHIAYNTLCLPPSSSVSLGDDCNTQKNLKTMVIRCEFFRGQTMYIMGNVRTVNNNSAFLLNPNHSMFTNLASRVCPFSNPPTPPPAPEGGSERGKKKKRGKILGIERLRVTLTPNGKREVVPRDQVFALIVVYCLLLLLKNK